MLPHDPAPLRRLVRETLIHAPAGSEPLPPDAALDGEAQHVVVRRAVALAVERQRRCGAEQSVLALGQRVAEDRGGHCPNYASTTVNLLNTPGWELLRSRIGSAAMVNLLTTGSLLSPLPNGSYLQLTGPLPPVGFGRSSADDGKRAEAEPARRPPQPVPPHRATSPHRATPNALVLPATAPAPAAPAPAAPAARPRW